MKNNILHIVLAAVLGMLLILLSDPFMIWMPPLAFMMTLLGAVIIVALWAGFVMKEQARDEREVMHRMNAGRAAYLAGALTLTLALVLQGIKHDVDPWIALSLMAMIIAKLVTRIYNEKYR